MIHELHDLLNRAGARVRGLRLWSSLAVCWLFWATVVYLVATNGTFDSHNAKAVWSIVAAGTALTALFCWQFATRAGRDPHLMAQRIEATHPELGAMLLAALEQAPSPRFQRLGYLQASVVRGAVVHGRRHNWADATSVGRLRLAKFAHFSALAALVASCLLLANRTLARGSAGAPAGDDQALIPGADYEAEIQPGDAEIERGTTLLVIAKFSGPMPPDADLVVQPAPLTASEEQAIAKGKHTSAIDPADALASTDIESVASTDKSDAQSVRSMSRSLDDPQFVARVPAVARPLSYFVEYAGKRSATYHVTVFEYPELVRADAHLAYPEYTQMEAKTVEDVRQVTAVEGTQLTLTFRLNKEVADARLIDRDGEETALKHAEGADPVYELSYKLAKTQRFKLHLTDAQHRKNKVPPEIVVNVTPNAPATIKLAKPGKDVRVSPVEELQVAASVTDDFGVTAYGLSYSVGGEDAKDVTLSDAKSQTTSTDADKKAPEKKVSLAHLIDFEALKAEPDQLVSYYVWAEDIGPDGKPRRTLSDMFFAEVRHFEEIFRQGEQPTEEQQREQQQQQQQQGQQGGAAQKAEELAEQEKQIVNATWKLVRREVGDTPSPEFAPDATAIQEAQQKAIDQLGELAGQVSEGQSQEFVENAQKHMQGALDALTRAGETPDVTALRPALSAAQNAYQALLKLRARENSVTRSNQGQQRGQAGSASGAGSASERQLQQLELSNNQNRYETQSRANASQQQNAQQLQESRQILNRLSELARRQQDLNQRLRELQSQLQEARTPAEREELERQLKRLRDQQREALRDAESLGNDMQNSNNRDQLQQSADQLEQTRSRLQDASHALEEGQVSQALTEGTRAERELSTLRDDFRQKTADRFTQEMRDLRDAAKELDERQQKLAEQLNQMNTERQSLRDAGPRDELLKGLGEQRQQLGDTLQKMRDTVTEAEEPEPLLARQLYDAVQQVGTQRTEQALDVSQQLTEAGVSAEASEPMRQAGRGIQQLREQIDRAAESVLGDETEALRRADQQLQALQEALNREIQQARGDQSGQQQAGQQQGQRQGSQAGQQNGQQNGQQSGQQGAQLGQQQGQQQGQGQGQQQGEGQGQQQGEGQGQQPGQGQGDQEGQGQGQGGQRLTRSQQQGGQSGDQAGQQSGDQTGEQQGRGQGQGQGQGEQPGGEQRGQTGQQGQRGQRGQRGQGGGQGQGAQGQQPGDGQGQNPQQGSDQAGNQTGQQQGEQSGQQPGEGQQAGQQQGQGGQGGGQGGDQGRQGQRGQGGQQNGQPNGQQGQGGQGEQNQQPDNDSQATDANAQPTEGNPGTPGGQTGNGGNPTGGRANGGQRNNNQRGATNNGPGGRGGAFNNGGGGLDNFQQLFTGGNENQRGPITGDNFRQWSEGMREVGDMLDDPDMSAEVARIRDRAEAERAEFVRHAKTPDWDKVVEMVSNPLAELREKIGEEIRRKESPDSLVPIDRDTAPSEFSEAVRLYYRRLGSGE